jgi:hypothetical protein
MRLECGRSNRCNTVNRSRTRGLRPRRESPVHLLNRSIHPRAVQSEWENESGRHAGTAAVQSTERSHLTSSCGIARPISCGRAMNASAGVPRAGSSHELGDAPNWNMPQAALRRSVSPRCCAVPLATRGPVRVDQDLRHEQKRHCYRRSCASRTGGSRGSAEPEAGDPLPHDARLAGLTRN